MRRFTLFIVSLCLVIGTALAQKTVSGVIVSAEDNEGIPASVRVKGAGTIGTSANIEGRFKLTVPTEAKTLIISSVGYKTQEVAIRPELRIVLQPESSTLSELVVTGYGSAKSIANTTASIVKVSSKSIQGKPVPNVFDALQGKVAGLQVLTSSGEPGAFASMKIHGNGTLSGLTSEPLYVLDGTPVSAGTVLGLNQNDFESIQVLKDASAISIYGSRAANGVIYLTSKRGVSSERATVTVRGKYGISSLANESYYKALMSTEELLAYHLSTGRFSPEEAAQIRRDYPNDFKWYKYFYKDAAPTYDADLSISGGSGRTSYYLSGSLLKSEGLRPRSGYDRYTMRANLNTALNDYVTISLNNSLSYDKSQATFQNGLTTSGGAGFMNLPWFKPYDEQGKPYDGRNIPGLDWSDIHYTARTNPSVSTSLNINSIGNLVVKPIKGLVLSATVGLNLTDGIDIAGRTPSHYQNVANGVRSIGNSRATNWTFSNTAEYAFDLKRLHHFTLLAGHEYLEYNYLSVNASGGGIEDDRLQTLTQATQEKGISESPLESASLSFFGRLSYNYDSKYFVDLTLRNDASSRFASAVRNGVFWSAGLKWRAKQEQLLRQLDWIDYADVRASYGTSGNSNVGNYDYIATVDMVGQYHSTPGWGLSRPGNPRLTWESQSKLSLGIDFGLWDKLQIGLEWYKRVTSDMLLGVPLVPSTGFGTLTQNIGKYQNSGIDLQVRGNLLKSKEGLNISTFFTLGYNRDKVLELFGGRKEWEYAGTGLTYVVGEPLHYYTALFKGVNPETGESEWYLPGTNRNVTQRDDAQVTNYFDEYGLRQNSGKRLYPAVNGGWGFDISYRGFYLNSEFAFTLGKFMDNNDGVFTDNPYKFLFLNGNRRVNNYWRKKGDIAAYPSVEYMKNNNNSAAEFDSRFLENASFMRLKSLTLGYQVPESLLNKQKFFKAAKLYITGRNLLTFTKFTGQDPEPDVNSSAGLNPNTKQVSVGLEVSF